MSSSRRHARCATNENQQRDADILAPAVLEKSSSSLDESKLCRHARHSLNRNKL